MAAIGLSAIWSALVNNFALTATAVTPRFFKLCWKFLLAADQPTSFFFCCLALLSSASPRSSAESAALPKALAAFFAAWMSSFSSFFLAASDFLVASKILSNVSSEAAPSTDTMPIPGTSMFITAMILFQ